MTIQPSEILASQFCFCNDARVAGRHLLLMEDIYPSYTILEEWRWWQQWWQGDSRGIDCSVTCGDHSCAYLHLLDDLDLFLALKNIFSLLLTCSHFPPKQGKRFLWREGGRACKEASPPPPPRRPPRDSIHLPISIIEYYDLLPPHPQPKWLPPLSWQAVKVDQETSRQTELSGISNIQTKTRWRLVATGVKGGERQRDQTSLVLPHWKITYTIDSTSTPQILHNGVREQRHENKSLPVVKVLKQAFHQKRFIFGGQSKYQIPFQIERRDGHRR
ncbi:hypothetical protein LguiB_022731 [Lonicera macranthoides]